MEVDNMTDITKCRGDGCPIKKQCYRFTAKDSRYQSYYLVVDADEIEKPEDCDKFISNCEKADWLIKIGGFTEDEVKKIIDKNN
jgi:hypothetical protein